MWLDSGSGQDENTLELASQIVPESIIALDYSRAVLEQAARRNIISVQASLNCTVSLRDGSVDVILASDVLEHLVEPAIFVARCLG